MPPARDVRVGRGRRTSTRAEEDEWRGQVASVNGERARRAESGGSASGPRAAVRRFRSPLAQGPLPAPPLPRTLAVPREPSAARWTRCLPPQPLFTVAVARASPMTLKGLTRQTYATLGFTLRTGLNPWFGS
jgi:hypothetical protein